MKKTKLNIRFHNPNTEEETIQYIAKIFVAVGVQRLEKEVESTIKKKEHETIESIG